MKPLIHVLPGELTIEHPDLLKIKGSKLGYSMARRALAVPGVEAVAIDTSKGHARIALGQDQGDQKGLLERVIKAIASEADAHSVDQALGSHWGPYSNACDQRPETRPPHP